MARRRYISKNVIIAWRVIIGKHGGGWQR